MKKLFGISVLSAMLILGQPLMAFADTTGSDATGPRIINFKDIGNIIAEQNIDVQINENDRLKSRVGFSDLKKTINDLEDDIEDINSQRDEYKDGDSFSLVIALGAEKRMLLDTLKQLERTVVDRPTLEAMIDLSASMSDDSQVRRAEGIFISYNQLKLASEDISLGIKTIQDQLVAMQLQESLGLVTRNNMNNLKTTLVDLQTKLESIKFQQDSLERQLKNILNDQENVFVIGSTLSLNEDSFIEDEDGEEDEDIDEDEDVEDVEEDGDLVNGEKDVVDPDFKKALENSYVIRLQEQQIVILQATLERTKKDNGMSSKQYKTANYELTNAVLKLTQMKDALKSDYYSTIEDITKKQSDLRLAEQNLEDKKVALSEAQVRMSLGMISRLEMDRATTDYQAEENAVKTKQINLFNAQCSYDWFLKGMPVV